MQFYEEGEEIKSKMTTESKELRKPVVESTSLYFPNEEEKVKMEEMNHMRRQYFSKEGEDSSDDSWLGDHNNNAKEVYEVWRRQEELN